MTTLPTVTVHEVSEKDFDNQKTIFIDVREPHELDVVSYPFLHIHLPLSAIQEKQGEALPEALKDQSVEIIVGCHHGGRSAQVVQWLLSNGWEKVFNMAGGIHAYATEIDQKLPTY